MTEKKSRSKKSSTQAEVPAAVPETPPTSLEIGDGKGNIVAPEPQPEPEEPKALKVGKFRGLKHGMRVMEFQDWQLAQNAERKLTDDELLAEMRAEFPNCTGKIFTADLATRRAILRGVRALYNAGTHSKGARKPETPSVEFTREAAAKAS